MYIFVAPRRIVLKEKEVQDFRAVAERLVDESGIEAEFPLVTERSPLLKVLIWILGLFSALMLGGMGICGLLVEEMLTIRFSSLVLCFSHVWWGSSFGWWVSFL